MPPSGVVLVASALVPSRVRHSHTLAGIRRRIGHAGAGRAQPRPGPWGTDDTRSHSLDHPDGREPPPRVPVPDRHLPGPGAPTASGGCGRWVAITRARGLTRRRVPPSGTSRRPPRRPRPLRRDRMRALDHRARRRTIHRRLSPDPPARRRNQGAAHLAAPRSVSRYGPAGAGYSRALVESPGKSGRRSAWPTPARRAAGAMSCHRIARSGGRGESGHGGPSMPRNLAPSADPSATFESPTRPRCRIRAGLVVDDARVVASGNADRYKAHVRATGSAPSAARAARGPE